MWLVIQTKLQKHPGHHRMSVYWIRMSESHTAGLLSRSDLFHGNPLLPPHKVVGEAQPHGLLFSSF